MKKIISGSVFVILICIVVIYIYNFNKNILMSFNVHGILTNNTQIETMSQNYNQTISKFYKGFPNEGYYIECLNKVKDECIGFLKKKSFSNLQGKAIVIDFDDTVGFTSPHRRINGQNVFDPMFGEVIHYPGIIPMIELVKKARKLGYYIIVITARAPSMLYDTISNLNLFGINPDAIFTSCFWGQPSSFKAIMRNNMEKLTLEKLTQLNSEQLYSGSYGSNSIFNIKIVMTIGDQWHDVNGQKNVLGVKLPDPNNMNSYFWYNDDYKLIN